MVLLFVGSVNDGWLDGWMAYLMGGVWEEAGYEGMGGRSLVGGEGEECFFQSPNITYITNRFTPIKTAPSIVAPNRQTLHVSSLDTSVKTRSEGQASLTLLSLSTVKEVDPPVTLYF